MPNTSPVAAVAGLLADPTRARMLAVLMDGQARTATELALEGGVTPSTTSTHLTRLVGAGLVALAKQGRHRYFRIASPDVRTAIESLLHLSRAQPRAPTRLGPRDEALRRARVCYDHLAGEAAVRFLDRLVARRLVTRDGDALALTPRGEVWCDSLGIDLSALRASRRLLCRSCLDWSERRAHLAGSLGAALFDRMVALRFARRDPRGRAVSLSAGGEAFIAHPERAATA